MLAPLTPRRSILLACLALVAAGPATAPVDREAALRAELDAANARIAALEAQVADLQRQLGGATERAAQADARVEAAEAARSDAIAAAAPSLADNGSVRALKRLVNENVRVGMTSADVKAILGEPKETRGNVSVYQRADRGRLIHGTLTPGARYTYELTFDDAGRLTAIAGEPR